MGDFQQLFDSLDPDPRIKGRQFEEICKWYLENDPTRRDLVAKVWLWSEWEHAWGIDAGIDLVVEDVDGHLWAVQSKAYDPAYSVSKADVDKFLSESSRKQFSYRLLIATTDKLHHIARKTINAQEKHVGFIGRADLLTAAVDWPKSPAALRPAKPRKPAKPRPYQRDAIKDVVKGFKTADRGQLIMACGTGKTLTSLFIKEKLAAERTLVLLPSLSLLKQTMSEWKANAATPFRALPVCSDESVTDAQDEPVAHTSELGLPDVTTDPAAIAEFLRRPGPRVLFSTYQSSPQIAAAFALGGVPEFDLAFADEAHRVAGDESTAFATILGADLIKAKRRLFMTATPRYYTGRVVKAAQESEMVVASMDDHAKFGEVFHRLSFGEAIRLGRLTDYQVAVIGVDTADETYRAMAENAALLKRDGKKTDGHTLASQIGLAKAMRKYDLHRVISFHSRISRARQFTAEMPEVLDWMPKRQRPSGPLWTGVATGEMTAGERHLRLQRLRNLEDGERGLLTNARCLSEGVDVPTLDGVAFIDPKGSEVDIIQAVGRAIRLAEDKTIGTIVIPVYIDSTMDPDAALNDSSFKAVWRVVKALRAHDEDLAEQIDSIRREMGRGGKPRVPDKIRLDMAAHVGEEFADAFDVRLVEQTTASWEFWFALLEKYAREHGTAEVSRNTLIDGHPISQWIGVQRTEFKNGKISEERRRRLEELPGWTWNVLTSRWDKTFRVLQAYVAEHGTSCVPQDFRVDGIQLGTWVTGQRSKRNQGRLSDERARHLEALPGWTWDSVAELWEDGFRHLEEYVELHGDALVPRGFRSEDGYQLDVWVLTQRQRFKKGKLEPERKARLESLPGWTWDRLEAAWDEGFENLLTYVEEHGDALVPFQYRTDSGQHLGGWVTNQRVDYGRGTLREDRQQKLRNLPGWTWHAKRELWEEGFAHLLEYIDQNGHSLAPVKYRSEDGYSLGQWIAAQRASFVQGQVPPDRRERLEAIPVWVWDATDARWEDGFRKLQNYVMSTGGAVVPIRYRDPEDGYGLGTWVNKQRQKFSKGALTAEQVSRLETLPGWSWAVHDGKWEEGFRHLEKFLSACGDVQVTTSYVDPEDGYKLGVWVGSQRGRWAKGTLQNDRVKRLEALPGWNWEISDNRWEEGFLQLVEYVQQTGTALVGAKHMHGGYPLGQWVNVQRTTYRDGTISSDRKKRLEQLPGWSWNPNADRWERMFALLEEYTNEHGVSRVPVGRCFKGEKLGTWVSSQRLTYSKGQMGIEQQHRFEALPGWTWTPGSGRWEKSFQLFRAYAAKHGSASPPRGQLIDGVDLGAWATNQRVSRSGGRLSPERQKLLEGLPGWTWDAVDTRWETMFSLLKDYATEHLSSQVPSSHEVDGYKLGAWVGNQRAFRRNGKLGVERQRMLESLPGWEWEPISTSWERAYGLMVEYVREYGNFVVPKSHSDAIGFDLGAWVNAQRTRYAKGTLPEDRQRRLEELPGWVWAVHDAKWEQGFHRLLEYVDRHGDTAMTSSCVVDGYRLGGWVVQQRSNYTKGVIKPGQQRRLEELPGWNWNALEARWEEGFRLVGDYIAEHGSANVPREYSVNGFKVGQWVREQRRVFAEGKTTEDRRKRLEELPGWVWRLR